MACGSVSLTALQVQSISDELKKQEGLLEKFRRKLKKHRVRQAIGPSHWRRADTSLPSIVWSRA